MKYIALTVGILCFATGVYCIIRHKVDTALGYFIASTWAFLYGGR